MPHRRTSTSFSSPPSFPCDYPGCNKSYGRPDHLARHKLNHNAPRLYRCESCNRSFVRSDLLERHLQRHVQWSRGATEGERPRKIAKIGNRGADDMSVDLRGDDSNDEFAKGVDAFVPPHRNSGPVASASMPPRPDILASMHQSRVEALRPLVVAHHPSNISSPTISPPRPSARPRRPGSSGSPGPPPHTVSFASTSPPPPPIAPATLPAASSTHDPFAPEDLLTSLFVPTNYSAGFDWLFDLDTHPPIDHHSVSSATTTTTSFQPTVLPLSGNEGFHGDEPPTDDCLGFLHDIEFSIPPEDKAYNVDPVALHRILLLLPSVTDLSTSSLFTVRALRCYLFLFFERFNTMYPLVHRPTFNASRADPSLLAAMILIGAHYAPAACHQMALRISQKMWGALISLEGFHAGRATLPMLQALVLTEAFSSRMASRQQHEMAHLFHNFIVTLARRNGAFSSSAGRGHHRYAKSHDGWALWAKNEERKRITLFVFILDAQHGALFRHVPALSAFQLQVDIPCSSAEWQAQTADEWALLQHRAKPQRFISALKSCLNTSSAPPSPSVTALASARGSVSQPALPYTDIFSRTLLLHGLMSVAYDLRWRQQQHNQLLADGNGLDSSSSATTRSHLSAWKQRLLSAMSSLSLPSRGGLDHLDSAHEAFHSISVVAQCIVLYADILELQVYAGLKSVCGQIVDDAMFQATKRSIQRWARTREAGMSVVIAAGFLACHFSDGQGGHRTRTWKAERGDDTLHTQWCLYLSVLVVWAHSHAVATGYGDGPPKDGLRGGNDTKWLARDKSAPPASETFGGRGHDILSDLEPALPLQGAYMAPSYDEQGDAIARDGGRSANGRHEGGAGRGRGSSDAENFCDHAFALLAQMAAREPEAIIDGRCPRPSMTPILEAVERELQGSRWELINEGARVLHNLIAARPVASAAERGVGVARSGGGSGARVQPGRRGLLQSGSYGKGVSRGGTPT